MIDRPPPAATARQSQSVTGQLNQAADLGGCVEVDLSLDLVKKYRTDVGFGDDGRAGRRPGRLVGYAA
jgi:hypothetical protein